MPADTPDMVRLSDRVAGFVRDYEFRGESDYSPSDDERALIEDAIHGFIAEAPLLDPALVRDWIERVADGSMSSDDALSALSASPLGASGEGALAPLVPTEQAGGPVVALFQHCTDDERWMVEAFGLAEFEKLSTDGHAGLADDLLRDAERADQRGEPGTGSRIRAASNFIKAAVSLRRKFPAPSTTSTAEQVGAAEAPVAWRYKLAGDDEWELCFLDPRCDTSYFDAVEPLYTRPTPATPAGEELREKLLAALIDALPPSAEITGPQTERVADAILAALQPIAQAIDTLYKRGGG